MSVSFLASISPAESKPPNDIENLLANPDAWDEIGEEYHDELDVIKAEMFWRRTIRKRFIHKADEAQPPAIAPAPLSSIPGTLLAPTLAVQINVDKYEDHLPHYRQSQRFRRRHDIDIERQTLNAWTHATARHLAPIDGHPRGNPPGQRTPNR